MDLYGLTFKYPFLLWGLLALPLLAYFEYRAARTGLNLSTLPLLKEVYRHPPWKKHLEVFLKLLIALFAVIMSANPGYTNVLTQGSKKGIDISIVLDISKSMLATDIEPDRLSAAKDVIRDFIDNLREDRISFILFAGKPFLSIPLTFDYYSIKNAIKDVSTDSIDQDIIGLAGTSIGDALIAAADSLTIDKDEQREKVIVFVTDGQAETGVDPRVAVKYVIGKGIKIYTIGIGKKEGTKLYISDGFGNRLLVTNIDGSPKIVKLDEDLLRYLASSTGGKYFNAQTKGALRDVFRELSKLNRREITEKRYSTFVPLYQIFIVAGALSALFLSLLKRKTVIRI